MKRPEEEKPGFFEELKLTGEKLCSAEGGELGNLLRWIERVKDGIRASQPTQTELGADTKQVKT